MSDKKSPPRKVGAALKFIILRKRASPQEALTVYGENSSRGFIEAVHQW